MCCSKKISKVLLVILNSIFFLLGGAVLGLGIFLLVDKTYITKILANVPVGQETVAEALDSVSMLTNLAYAFIAGGAFVFIVGFCGCFGAIKESKCLLLIYAIIVFLIIALEITAGVLAYLYGDKVEAKVQSFMLSLITDYYSGAYLTNNELTLSTDTTGVSDAWDFAMAYFECCGTYNYTDFGIYATAWPGVYNFTVSGVSTSVASAVPITCCKMSDPSVFPSDLASVSFVNATDCFSTASSYSTNQIGCYQKIKDLVLQYSYVAMGVGIAVGVVEVSLLLAAMCLYRMAGQDKVDDVKRHP